MTADRAVEVTVRGIVQGVGFRWFASRQAGRSGLAGWVVNQADGSVFVVAQGEAGAVDRFVDALREGPPGASVTAVEVVERAVTGMGGRFEIRSGAHRGD